MSQKMTTPETAPDALNPILHEPKAKLQPRLTPEELEYRKKPKVLIVGAGIGGITLAILLQKAGYPYAVFERAKEVKPLGKKPLFFVLYALSVRVRSLTVLSVTNSAPRFANVKDPQYRWAEIVPTC